MQYAYSRRSALRAQVVALAFGSADIPRRHHSDPHASRGVLSVARQQAVDKDAGHWQRFRDTEIQPRRRPAGGVRNWRSTSRSDRSHNSSQVTIRPPDPPDGVIGHYRNVHHHRQRRRYPPSFRGHRIENAAPEFSSAHKDHCSSTPDDADITASLPALHIIRHHHRPDVMVNGQRVKRCNRDLPSRKSGSGDR